MSHWSWCDPASWYPAFLFLSFLPSALQSLLSQDSLLSKCVQAIAFSFPIQCLKAFFSLFTMSHTYSLVLWSFQLIFSIFRQVHISKASNLSLLYFISVQVSDQYDSIYNLLLQIFAHSLWKEFSSFVECVNCNSALNLCCSNPIIWDERSQITKLVHLLITHCCVKFLHILLHYIKPLWFFPNLVNFLNPKSNQPGNSISNLT